LGIVLLLSCSGKEPQVDRIIEDGVEIVLNHKNPYLLGGKPVSFRLEEELRINFLKSEFADLGLAWPAEAHADSKGNIFVLDRYRKSKYFISKFSKSGAFAKSIGRVGQGPGEIQSVVSMGVDSQDNVWVCSPDDKRIVFYNGEGEMVKEKRYPPHWWSVEPLKNGSYLALGSAREKSSAGTGYHVWLYDANFHEVNLLDFYDSSRLLSGEKYVGIPLLTWKAHEDKIYVGNEQRHYEILVYNLDGRLLRKIRKEHKTVPYPKKFKEDVARDQPSYSTLEYCPPFNSFFVDDKDYLFVMTYEKGIESDEYLHDIFNEEGVFVGRASLGISGSLGRALNRMHAIARGGRYYRLRFKGEEDYPEMVVYRMIRN
jgi:hypothetical protein